MKSVTALIGIVHEDPKGAERLEKLLEYIEPDIITVETSDVRLRAVKTAKKELVSILEQKGVDRGLAEKWASQKVSPLYEWYTSKKYAKKHNIPIHRVDLPYLLLEDKEDTKKALEIYRGMDVKESDVRKKVEEYELDLREGRLQLKIDIRYDKFLLENTWKNNPANGIGIRDVYMAERLKELRKHNPSELIVHVGGVMHMVEAKCLDVPTLYMLLPEVDEDRVVLLPIADFIGD